MRSFTDEELVAYADGELPPMRADEIAQAARDDASVSERIKAFKDSRRLLKDAFASQLAAPVPERLRALLAEPKVVELRARVRWKVYVPLAAAALVVLGVGLNANRLPGPPREAGTAVAVMDTTLLSDALETAASGVPVTRGDKEVLPLKTLRTAQGQWCREFESRAGAGASMQKSRGIACRNPDAGWDLRVIATAPQGVSEPQDGYRTADGGNGGLAGTLGSPQTLTPAEEQERIQHHWN